MTNADDLSECDTLEASFAMGKNGFLYGNNDDLLGGDSSSDDSSAHFDKLVEDHTTFDEDDTEFGHAVENALASSSYQHIDWSPPKITENRVVVDSRERNNALLWLQCATMASRQFEDDEFPKDPVREATIPKFLANELITSRKPIRQCGNFAEYALRAASPMIHPTRSWSAQQDNSRRRFMERSIDGCYTVRYLQAGVLESEHGPMAACSLIREAQILMNLAPHPNLAQIYAVADSRMDASLDEEHNEFFFVTERTSDTLKCRLEAWQDKKGYDYLTTNSKFHQRLEVGMGIAAGLKHLHERGIVYHLRPDKVGFDITGDVKLLNMSEVSKDGMERGGSRANAASDVGDIDTLAYKAPEELCRGPVTTSTDVYAFGILLWQILSLRRPFDKYDRAMHFSYVVEQHRRPPMNTKWPVELKRLLEGCWNPHVRLTMAKAQGLMEEILKKESNADRKVTRQKPPTSPRKSPMSSPGGKPPTPVSMTGVKMQASGLPQSPFSRRPKFQVPMTTGGLGSKPKLRRDGNMVVVPKNNQDNIKMTSMSFHRAPRHGSPVPSRPSSRKLTTYHSSRKLTHCTAQNLKGLKKIPLLAGANETEKDDEEETYHTFNASLNIIDFEANADGPKKSSDAEECTAETPPTAPEEVSASSARDSSMGDYSGRSHDPEEPGLLDALEDQAPPVSPSRPMISGLLLRNRSKKSIGHDASETPPEDSAPQRGQGLLNRLGGSVRKFEAKARDRSQPSPARRRGSYKGSDASTSSQQSRTYEREMRNGGLSTLGSSFKIRDRSNPPPGHRRGHAESPKESEENQRSKFRGRMAAASFGGSFKIPNRSQPPSSRRNSAGPASPGPASPERKPLRFGGSFKRLRAISPTKSRRLKGLGGSTKDLGVSKPTDETPARKGGLFRRADSKRTLKTEKEQASSKIEGRKESFMSPGVSRHCATDGPGINQQARRGGGGEEERGGLMRSGGSTRCVGDGSLSPRKGGRNQMVRGSSLRQTEVYEKLKTGGYLSKPFTAIPHEVVSKHKGNGRQKPDWVTQSPLRKTAKGVMAKTGAELGRPIYGIKPIDSL